MMANWTRQKKVLIWVLGLSLTLPCVICEAAVSAVPTWTNVDATGTENRGTGAQTVIVNNAPAPTDMNAAPGAGNGAMMTAPVTPVEPEPEELTEEEINRYFDEALNWENEDRSGTGSSARPMRAPMEEILRKLPRYGMRFFRQPQSTYAPLDSVPVTPDYLLGPDDEMTITLWGIPEEGNYKVRINRDGMAIVPHIGAVRLAGYNLIEAQRVLHARFDQYFTGYQMNVSMGNLRSIMVYVTGNVRRPGAYTVSSFATLVNALLVSGGPSENGTMRRIELKRGSRTVTTFDMYAMLLKGDKSQDVRLEAGDVIFVPPVGPLVGLAGEVRDPGVYELNGNTRVKDLLHITGGLNAQTFKGRIQYYKVYNQTYRGVSEGSFAELAETLLEDGATP